MKIRLLFILTLISVTAFSAAAQQRRTVTNDNLEKYRQKRVAAERDLRENYEHLGFPSPDELERQIEDSRQARAELADRLRTESLERERLGLERERLNLDRRIAESEAQQRSAYQSFPNNGFYGGANDFFLNYGYAPIGSGFPNYGFGDYDFGGYGFGGYGFPGYGFLGYGYPNKRGNRFNRGNFRYNQPRFEYRNNLPVFVPPPGRRIAAPRSRGR
jgi:hypothetical protein